MPIGDCWLLIFPQLRLCGLALQTVPTKASPPFKALAEIWVQTSVVLTAWKPKQVTWRHNLPIRPDEIVGIFPIRVPVISRHTHPGQLVSRLAAGVVACWAWALLTLHSSPEMWNHHLDNILNKYKGVFEGQGSFHSIQEKVASEHKE